MCGQAVALALAGVILLPALAGAGTPSPHADTFPTAARDSEALLEAWAALQPQGTSGAILAAEAQAMLAAAERSAPPPGRGVRDALAALLEPAGAERAQPLLRALDLADSAGSGHVAAPALALDALRVAPRPATRSPLPPMPHFDSLPAALAALFAWYGHVPSMEERARVAALGGLPDDVGAAVMRVVEAHLLQAAATRVAVAPLLRGDAVPEAVDLGLLLDAREAVAREVLGALPHLRVVPGVPPLELCPGQGIVQLPPNPGVPTVFGLDAYATVAGAAVIPVGIVINLTGGDSTYGCDAALTIDAGGNDVYFNNAGGASGGAAMLVDLGGDDLYDATYVGAGGIIGGGSTGMGFLLDAAGDDTYNATISKADGLDLVHGPKCIPCALSGGAANGGGAVGAGVLLDLAGNDTYAASVGVAGAVNGGARVGAGFLFDAGGDDTYQGHVGDGGVNGGAGVGTGFLLDRAGDDTYAATAPGGGLNGGSLKGAGFLLDGAGNDTYHGTLAGDGGVNGGTQLGLGVLVDQGGTNRFEGSVGGAGGSNGAAGGFALLQSVSVSLPAPLPPLGVEVAVSSPGGLGLLLAGPGDDTYVGHGTTQGAADSYALGILVDQGGRNTYTAGPDGLAQGAGRNFGVGVLLDLGSETTFTLLGTTAGQGAGLQGAGLLVRGNEDGETTYAADLTARPSVSSGAGLGLRLDVGRVRFLNPPSFACASPEVQGVQPNPGDPVLVEIHVCAPDDGAREVIVNPSTGLPLAPLPKPPLPCSGLGLPAWVDCTFLENGEIDPTTGGGLAMLTGKDPVTDRRILRARYTVNSADSICGTACFTGLVGGAQG